MSDASANNKYKSLAKAALSNNPPDGCIDASSLKKSVKLDISVIFRAYKASKITEKQGKTLPSHLEWIADNYYIFNIQLERPRSGTKMYARFEAYSPDKFLTLDKYCKAYTALKCSRIRDRIGNNKKSTEHRAAEKNMFNTVY